MVTDATPHAYVVVQTEIEELPFGDRVDDAIPPEIV